jgi:hypothetical protein
MTTTMATTTTTAVTTAVTTAMTTARANKTQAQGRGSLQTLDVHTIHADINKCQCILASTT